MQWSKPDDRGRSYAQIRSVTVGYISPVPACAHEEYAWELTALGAVVGVEIQGRCLTMSGAKKAMLRNWRRWCNKFNLTEKFPCRGG